MCTIFVPVLFLLLISLLPESPEYLWRHKKYEVKCFFLSFLSILADILHFIESKQKNHWNFTKEIIRRRKNKILFRNVQTLNRRQLYHTKTFVNTQTFEHWKTNIRIELKLVFYSRYACRTTVNGHCIGVELFVSLFWIWNSSNEFSGGFCWSRLTIFTDPIVNFDCNSAIYGWHFEHVSNRSMWTTIFIDCIMCWWCDWYDNPFDSSFSQRTATTYQLDPSCVCYFFHFLPYLWHCYCSRHCSYRYSTEQGIFEFIDLVQM